MFGKLLKNDLKAQWHSFTVIFICIFIVGGVAETIAMYCAKDVFGIFKTKLAQALCLGIAEVIVILVMLFACVMTLIAVAITFSKSTYGKTGYLTLTLPVKTSSLIWSKTLTGLLWTYVAYTLFIISFFIWIPQMGNCLGGEIKDMADQILVMLFGTSFKSIVSLAIYYLSWVAVAIFLMVQCLYFAITCSHCKPLSNVSALFAILIFFGSFAIIFGLALTINKILPFGMLRYEDFFTGKDIFVFSSNVVRASTEKYYGAFRYVFSGPLFMLMASVGLSFPTTILTKHRINIS